VERLSDAWGFDPERDGGKVVWFEITRRRSSR